MLDGHWFDLRGAVSTSPAGAPIPKAVPSLLKAINVASVVGCTTVEENVHRLYKPIIQAALADWDSSVIRVIEDTTMLWNQYCLVRLSVQYRGRAVVLGWRVLEQSSSSVALKEYQDLLRASAKLLPSGVKVIFLADRGES